MAKQTEALVHGVLTQVMQFDHSAQEIDDTVDGHNKLQESFDDFKANGSLTPTEHAHTHASDGVDPITPDMIGAYSKDEVYSKDETYNKTETYDRDEISNMLNSIKPKFEIELLWENASPGGNFPAQTIGIDLTPYKSLEIHSVNGGVDILDDFQTSGMTAINARHVGVQTLSSGRPYISFATRMYIIKADFSGIEVRECVSTIMNDSSFGATTNTNYIKPIAIYGIKGEYE